jgi:CubicO group peptidase (beta-lactamase class C family)
MVGVTEQLVADMPGLMTRAHVPGVSLSLLQHRQPVWSAGFGRARKGSGQAIEHDTLFQAASLSKPVFAYAVLELVDQGVLELDRPLTQYLPDRFVDDDELLDRVTARHVLSHTAGWPNWRPRGEPLRREFAPGERFGYSGEGYVYLQRVVEHLTGEALAPLVQARVLEPLGVTRSSFAWPPIDARTATGHDREGMPIAPRPTEPANAAFSFQTTPTDFARFMAALLVPRDPSSVFAEMLRPQVPVDERLGWGLGWGLELRAQGHAFWHWGDNPGYQCFAIALLDSGTGAVVMTNGDRGRALYAEVVRHLLGTDHPALVWLGRRYRDAG